MDNTDYPTGGGHLTSRDTQTNWNGIVGRIELRAYHAYAQYVYAYTGDDLRSLHVRAEIVGENAGTAEIRVYDDEREYGSAAVEFTAGKPVECDIKIPEDVPLWSDNSPDLVTLEVAVGGDIRQLKVGIRRLSHDDRTLLVNGRQAFLRGKHDGMVFPATGYMPTDVDSWLEFFGKLA